jgi:hypothetical protein
MSGRSKTLFLIFGLVLPYSGLVMYFVSRLPEHPLPLWFPYFGAFYLLGTVVLVAVVAPRFSSGLQYDGVENPPAASPSVRWRALSLVAFWCVFLVYGTYKTLTGAIPVARAIPAGLILSAGIGLFSWLLYRDYNASVHHTKR